MSKARWPEWVWFLEEGDISRCFTGLGGTHNLVGWAWELFPGAEPHRAALAALLRATGGEALLRELRIGNSTLAPGAFVLEQHLMRWCRHRRKSTIANVWNRAMAELGYTEVYPAAKRSER